MTETFGTPLQAALRELKEECGYVGKVTETSPELCLSPGLSDETAAFVKVTIDLSGWQTLTPCLFQAAMLL